MIYVGIDVGLDGAMAALTDSGDVAGLCRMPLLKNQRERREVSAGALAAWLLSLPQEGGLRVLVEYVHSFGHESRSSMFSFGRSDGKTRAALELLGLPHTDVDPRAWKNAVLPGTKKDKLAAIDYCRTHWGEEDLTKPFGLRCLTDGMADALCIAEYARSHAEWGKTTPTDKKE